jgi:hypothetical protein
MPILIWISTIACLLEMMNGGHPYATQRVKDRNRPGQ